MEKEVLHSNVDMPHCPGEECREIYEHSSGGD